MKVVKENKEMKEICCRIWKENIEGIKITANYRCDDEKAKTLEGLIKYWMGNYCPTCGRKLNVKGSQRK